jgi:carotenoid cleavage dioxygenase
MLHRISLEGDTVLYSNSWIEPARTGRPCPPTFGAADVIAGGRLALLRILLLKAMALVAGVPAPPLERSQAGGTSVVKHAGRLLAATEVFLPFEVSVTRDGVRPVGFTTLGGLLEQRVGPAEGTFSAHPRLDPDSGQLYFFSKNSGPDALPLLAFGALHANGTPDRYFHLPVPSPPAAFHHDMVLTDHHAVTVDPSLRRDTARLLAGRGATFFDPDYKMRFAVLPRSATGPEAVRWVECPG